LFKTESAKKVLTFFDKTLQFFYKDTSTRTEKSVDDETEESCVKVASRPDPEPEEVVILDSGLILKSVWHFRKTWEFRLVGNFN